jgi:transcriptional regulator with XRE-family HTH domain
MAKEIKVVAKNIKKARILAEITQKDLAKKLGYDRQVVIRMESGVRKISAEELKEIAKITGQPLSFFYDEFDIGESYRRYALSKEVRDLSDLSSEDIRFIDELLRRLRDKK